METKTETPVIASHTKQSVTKEDFDVLFNEAIQNLSRHDFTNWLAGCYGSFIVSTMNGWNVNNSYQVIMADLKQYLARTSPATDSTRTGSALDPSERKK